MHDNFSYEVIEQKYHHIDNGGMYFILYKVTRTIDPSDKAYEPDFKDVSLELHVETQYFGHPSVKAVIPIDRYSHKIESYLIDVGEMISKLGKKVKLLGWESVLDD